MSGGIRLDIHKDKWNQTEGIKCETYNIHGGYNSYKYYSEPGKGKPFGLSAILYDGEFLPGILPYPVPVNYLFTYFNNSWTKLLGLHLQRNDTQTYFLNPDTDRDIKYVTFTEFTVNSGSSLGNRELWDVLGNVEADHGFNLGRFGTSHRSEAKKLVGDRTCIIFDLEKKNRGDTYTSEVTDKEVTVIDYGIKVANTYPKIQHAPTTEPFYIKGLQLSGGHYVKVKGGFPNEPLDGSVNVYYKSVGNTDPLLIELKLKTLQHGNYIPVSGKLKDLTKDLEIDLTQTSPSSGSTYPSGKTIIDYKKEDGQVETYSTIRHASKFPSFTVGNIKTGSGGNITGNNLPPSGTLLGGLYAYYADSSYNKLVLIELIGFHNPELNRYPMYVYYYYRDGNSSKWQGYLLSTTVNNSKSDISKVITHVKQNADKVVFEKLEGNLKGRRTKYPPDPQALIHKVTEGRKGEQQAQVHQQDQGPSSGSSPGEIASYTTGSLIATGATETANFFLNPGWSLIRRVMAIFNAAI